MSVLDALMDISRTATKNVLDSEEDSASKDALQKIKDGYSVSCQYCDEPGKHIRYFHIKKGIMKCIDCSGRSRTRCRTCKDSVLKLDIIDEGLYKGNCVDCTRCSYCSVPMWDYVCACEYR